MSVSFFKEAANKATPSELLRRADDVATLGMVAEKLNTPEKYQVALRTFKDDLPAIKDIFEGNAVTLKV